MFHAVGSFDRAREKAAYVARFALVEFPAGLRMSNFSSIKKKGAPCPTFSRPVTSRRYTQRFTTAFSGGGLAAAYNCVTNAILPTRGSLWAAGVLKGLIARPSMH